MNNYKDAPITMTCYVVLIVFVLFPPTTPERANSFDEAIADARGNEDLTMCLYTLRRDIGSDLHTLQHSRRINHIYNLVVVAVVELLTGPIPAALAATTLAVAVERDNDNFETKMSDSEAVKEAECYTRFADTETPGELDLPLPLNTLD